MPTKMERNDSVDSVVKVEDLVHYSVEFSHSQPAWNLSSQSIPEGRGSNNAASNPKPFKILLRHMVAG
jgi:hypothetical protein